MGMNLASATLNLSPGKLYFNINPNEEICQMIVLSSTDYIGEINIRDVWAKSFDEGSNTNTYDKKAEDFGIEIYYDNLIENFDEEEEIEVCLSGSTIRKSKGAIIFTPKSETNVVVEVGTWLFVTISEPPQMTTTSSGGGGEGSSGGGGGGIVQQTITSRQKSSQENTEVQEISEQKEEENAGITGAVIGGGKKSGKIIGITLVAIGVIGLLINYQYKKRRQI